jgi:hypothetical protein
MATLADTPRTQTFTLASATAGPFDITIRLFSTDLRVTVNDVATEAYSVTATFADGYEDDATITFDEALEIGDVVVIDPILPPARDVNYSPTEPGLTAKLNIELARSWSVLQQFARDFTRSLKLPSNATQSKEIAAPTAPNQILSSNDDNTGFRFGPATLTDVASASANAATAAAAAAAAEASALEASLFDGRQWNLVGRPVSVSVTPFGSGVLNGTYYWSVSYVTEDGETDVSNATVGTPANQQSTITIPVSADPRVTARKIYRTTVGAVEPQNAFLVGTVSDNTTTTFVDNVADGSLGARAPHIDTSAGKILNGTQVIGAVSELSTTFGINAMPSGQGYACTAIGGQALENNAGGYRNTAVGTNALDANTTGFNNTAMGVHALDENTTGQDNTAFGLGALFVHPDGLGNTAVGANAAVNMAAGDENTFIGYTAGQLKTSGAQNVVVGAGSMYADGSGQSNTAVGYRALRNCTSGSFNMAFGLSAGINITTGVANVLVGAGAGAAITTGERNVAIGPGAGTWEMGSNSLWIDGFERANLADAEAKALITGTFATTRAGQELNVNGQINPLAGLGMPGRTVTADGAVTVDDTVITCDKSGSTLTLTLPTGKADKILILRNHEAQTVVSASANVQPIGGGAVTPAILPATVGAWAMIRAFDASNWEIVMAG